MKKIRHKGTETTGNRVQGTGYRVWELALLLGAWFVFLTGAPAFASHEWTMFRGDARGSGLSSSTLTLPLTSYWTAQSLGEVASSPVKYKNRLCFGSRDKNIYCLNAFTGQKIWQYPTGGWVDAAPATVSDTLYAGSYDGKFYALDISTGTLKWQFDTGTGGVIASSAVISGNTVYFGSAKIPGSALYALNKDSGGILWKVDVPQPVYSSPVIAGNTLLVGDNRGKLLAFDAQTGAQNWMFSSSDGRTFLSSPSISADGTTAYFAAGYFDKKIYAVSVSSGMQKWQYATSFTGNFIYVSSPVSSGGKVFFAAGDSNAKVSNLYALNESTGTLLWQASLGDGTDEGFLSTPVISGNTVFQATGNGKLYGFDVSNGSALVNFSLGNKIVSSPAVANGMLFAVTAEGKAYAYRGEDGGTMPSVSITAPANAQTINKTFSITGTATDMNLKDYTLYYRYENAPSSYVFIDRVENSVETTGTLTTWNTKAVADGQYTLLLRGTDIVGNQQDVSRTLFVDNTPPALTVSQPQDNLLTTGATAAVQGVTDAGSQLTINGVSVPLGAGSGSFNYTFTLAEGQNTITVASSDAVGNTITAVRTVTKDTTAPVITVTEPADNLVTNQSSANVSGTTETGVSLTINGTAVSVDAQGKFSKTLTLSEGLNTVTVVATDAAQNSGTVTRKVTLDTTAPGLTITSPQDGAITNAASVTVSGSTEPGAALKVNGTQTSLDAQGNFSAAVSLNEGSNAITVESKDAAGNTAAKTRTVVKDTNSPQISVSSPPDNFITTQSAVTVSGSTKIGSTVTLNGSAVSVDAQGNFSAPVSLNEGINTLKIDAKDTAGNAASITRTVTKDTTAPVLTLSAPQDNAVTNQTQLKVSGSTEAGVTLKVNAAAATVNADGSFEAALTLSEGKNTVTAEAADAAGNKTTVTRTVTLDTKPPTVSLKINGGAVYTDKKDVKVTLTAADNDGGTGVKDVMVSEDVDFKNASWQAVSQDVNLTLSGAYEKKTVYVKVRDAAGNESAKVSAGIEYVSYVSASVNVNSSQLVGDDKTIKVGLTLPQNLAGSIQVIFAEAQNVPEIAGHVGKSLRLKLLFSGTAKEKEVTQSDSTAVKTVAKIQMSYADSKTQAGNENNLRVYVLSNNTWTKVSGFQEVSPSASSVTAQTPLILNKDYVFTLIEESASTAAQNSGALKAFNYPNPAHGDTTFAYSLDDGIPLRVTIEVYSIAGKRVLFLEDPTPQDGKYTTAEIDSLPNGIYVYRMLVTTAAKTFSTTGRFVLLK